MKRPLVIDTLHRVATPEGCEITLRIAGPMTRARAWLLDFLIRVALWIAMAFVAGFAGRFGFGLFMVAAFLLEWFYPVLFEVYMHGQTPGKRACKLVVLHDDGRPVGWGASFVRNTLRFIDFFPIFYAAGFVTSLLNRDGKRLGDLAAGTVVAHFESGNTALPGEHNVVVTGAEPPPVPLSIEEQQALIEYRSRAAQLTEERSFELAELLVPLTGNLRPQEARLKLLKMANFLLGER
ncbi:MAG: domain containing protein [Proteobacteria bacterium]|nr:domain containing protein [Pseudomonadota bacterium]